MLLRTAACAAAVAALAALLAGGACRRETAPVAPSERPSILLVTLDTTRFDAIGPGAAGIDTPGFNALAARGRRFLQAYATAPETLPSHSSMLTGLYPAGHGVRENARPLPANHLVLAERLQQAGYRSAAFVSSFVLARRFGLARGFDPYDDELPQGQVERSSSDTTARAIAYLQRPADKPLFVWVHYFDPHTPYAPPGAYSSKFGAKPYLGEVAAMDEQLGRLLDAFERLPGARATIVVSDHGEGLGDHGESQHGNLLYQSTVHVPLAIAGPGVAAGTSDEPVSIRRVFHTVLDWAGLGATDSLRSPSTDVVLAEAMRPFLGYGWQPQIMAVSGRHKAIYAGRLEVYDVVADPAESRELGASVSLPPLVRRALEDYPMPAQGDAAAPAALSDDARKQLATLGYVSAGTAPVIRKDAPRPADMVHVFGLLEQASSLFVREQYREVIPVLEKILAADSHNLDAALRLATAYSATGQDARADAAFARAGRIAPASPDVRVYRALHYARGTRWKESVPLLEQIVAESPDRLPAVEALAIVRERQGRIAEAVALRQKVYAARTPTPRELAQLGTLAMETNDTAAAIDAFEKARASQRESFAHDLELGVLYLSARRFNEARTALDRVPPAHPEYPMALFKRAQVSVLLDEPDKAARVQRARAGADATTRELIAREKLFSAVSSRQ